MLWILWRHNVLEPQLVTIRLIILFHHKRIYIGSRYVRLRVVLYLEYILNYLKLMRKFLKRLNPLGVHPIIGLLDSEGVTWCRLRWELQESAALLSRLTRHVTAYLNPKDCLDWFNKLKPTPFFYIRLVVAEKGHF